MMHTVDIDRMKAMAREELNAASERDERRYRPGGLPFGDRTSIWRGGRPPAKGDEQRKGEA